MSINQQIPNRVRSR